MVGAPPDWLWEQEAPASPRCQLRLDSPRPNRVPWLSGYAAHLAAQGRVASAIIAHR